MLCISHNITGCNGHDLSVFLFVTDCVEKRPTSTFTTLLFRPQAPPVLIMLSWHWQAFDVRGSRGVLNGCYVCVCVCEGHGRWGVTRVERYWWCVVMGHKGEKQREERLMGVQRQDLGGGRGNEQKPVWNSSHKLEWLDWLMAPNRSFSYPFTMQIPSFLIFLPLLQKITHSRILSV